MAENVNQLLHYALGVGCFISVEHQVTSQGAVAVVVMVGEAGYYGLCCSIGRCVVVSGIIFSVCIEDCIGILAYLHKTEVILIAGCTLDCNTAYYVVITVATVRIEGCGG